MSDPQCQSAVKEYADQIMMMVTLQLKQIHTKHLVDFANSPDSLKLVFDVHTMCTALVMKVHSLTYLTIHAYFIKNTIYVCVYVVSN